MKKIEVYPGGAEVFEAAADFLVNLSNASIASSGRCAIALPGGNTPRGVFQLLTKEPYRSAIPWPQIHFFWGDERCVSWDHSESNYRLARETFLGPLAVPDENLHAIVTDNLSPLEAAEAYEQELFEFFQLRPGEYPRFDLVLLGMGVDGHTASLFPDGPELSVRERLVTWAWPKEASTPRVTLTLETINHAQHVAFLVIGKDKAAMFRRVLDARAKLPAALIKPKNGRVTFFLDEDAGLPKCEL